MSGTNLRCVFCSKYLIRGTAPRQAPCGDRLCEVCLTRRGKVEVVCPSCNEDIDLSECFRDKAVELDAANVTVKCSNKECPWEGLCADVQAHEDKCRFVMVACKNAGCNAQVQRSQINTHSMQCAFQTIPCPHCSAVVRRGDLQTHTNQDCPSVEVECRNRCGYKASRTKMQNHISKKCSLQASNCSYVSCTCKTHIKKECDQVPQYCPNGCGERLPKREMLKHTRTVCTHQIRDCVYKDLGCQSKGNIKELTKHSIEYTAYHLQLMKNKEVKQSLAERKTSTQLTTVMTGLSALKTEVAQLKQTGASTTTANEMDGGAISCLNQSPHCEESKVKDRTTLVGGTPLTTSVMEEEHGNRLKLLESRISALEAQMHSLEVTRIQEHFSNECTSDCSYVNCTFKGTKKQLQDHVKKEVVHHVHWPNEAIRDTQQASGSLISRGASQPSQLLAVERQVAIERERALSQVVADLTSRLQVNFSKLESDVQHLQDGYSEMALSLQTLQATSYDGRFVWKIPEVQRRRREAVTGKTTSLYSAPFQTSHHGYKLCLRLYMNGDGSGKGTHLSFFITLMRGERDALLSWPFRQAVALVLVDQNKQRDIVQSFRPEPTSSSFQRPCSEMNIASGCSMFAPLSVLDNSSFVKDDTMLLKCKVDLVGT